MRWASALVSAGKPHAMETRTRGHSGTLSRPYSCCALVSGEQQVWPPPACPSTSSMGSEHTQVLFSRKIKIIRLSPYSCTGWPLQSNTRHLASPENVVYKGSFSGNQALCYFHQRLFFLGLIAPRVLNPPEFPSESYTLGK